MAGKPVHVNEPLSRVIATLLLRQDPGKARKWVDDMKQQPKPTGDCREDRG